jgi:hypothetical protein
MEVKSIWRKYFVFVAWFNFVAAALMLFAPDLFYQILFIESRIQKDVYLYLDLFAALVFVFGWGYWRVSRDPIKNSEIIVMGILGKSSAFAIAWYHYIFFNGPLGFALLVVLDLIFVIIFIYFYISVIRQKAI